MNLDIVIRILLMNGSATLLMLVSFKNVGPIGPILLISIIGIFYLIMPSKWREWKLPGT